MSRLFDTRSFSSASSSASSSRFDDPRLISVACHPPFSARISDYLMFDHKSSCYLFSEHNRFLFTCSSFDTTCHRLIFTLAFPAARVFDSFFPGFIFFSFFYSYPFLPFFFLILPGRTGYARQPVHLYASRPILIQDSSPVLICSKKASNFAIDWPSNLHFIRERFFVMLFDF